MNGELPSCSQITKKRKIKEEPKANVTKKCKLIKIETTPVWNDYELLAEQKNLENSIARNLVNLFKDENTIPFIARYRKEITGNLSPELLREVKDSFDEICQLKEKINTSINSIAKLGKLNPDLEKAVKSVKSLEELKIINAPFKTGSTRTLAERAKELGLEKPAMDILNNIKGDLKTYIDRKNKDLGTIENVENGIVHIIAYVFASDADVLSYLRILRTQTNFVLEVKKSQSKKNDAAKGKENNSSKFEKYYNFTKSVNYVKPHQTLAINRGENLKILTAKIVVPDYVFNKFSQFCCRKWMYTSNLDLDPNRKRIIHQAIKDSYNRLVQPLIMREVRAELKQNAEKESFNVFSTNLKHLLLTSPLKGKPILAIDPGYRHGCKLALVSPTGTLVAHNIIHLDHNADLKHAQRVLKNMLLDHECSFIALGNGTACRQTEQWLTDLIENKVFHPLEVQYTIVNEDGASIYSCSPEAKKEFPDLDTNIISAVSIGRRVQDPLAELVKIEPRHIGVGMYQHDLNQKQLEETLNDVVSECVSFVGVDLNTASQCLLRRIAGLTDKRASSIIEHREKKGPFLYRAQLRDVRGIGPKTFEQCAGFLRVGPTDIKEKASFYKKPKTTKLDCTYVHPESYDVANRIIKKIGLNPEDIGEPHFIDAVKSSKLNAAQLSKELGCSEETITLIFENFMKPLNYDLRCEVSQVALFRKGLISIHDIHAGTSVTGIVRNVTNFGCFVDVGIEKDGLIHQSQLCGHKLQIGDRVEANVIDVDAEKQRVSLRLVRKLEV